jgi:hypothetical protein
MLLWVNKIAVAMGVFGMLASIAISRGDLFLINGLCVALNLFVLRVMRA